MIVLAIDPSLTTGWATNASDRYYAGDGGHVRLDTVVKVSFGWPHPAPQDLLARRLAAARRWLVLLTDAVRPDLIVVERQSRNELLCQLEGIFLAVAGEREAMSLRVWAGTWMAHAKKNGWQKLPDPEGAVADAKAILAWAIDAHDLNNKDGAPHDFDTEGRPGSRAGDSPLA